MSMIKQDIDAWLDQVDYRILNSADYMPSEFALIPGGNDSSNCKCY